ncbi:MAG: hypothetical protein IJ632_00475 [Muribaculaceae bacterium]|nr:hypothetical protein [Muribaculaceae bacterium]
MRRLVFLFFAFLAMCIVTSCGGDKSQSQLDDQAWLPRQEVVTPGTPAMGTPVVADREGVVHIPTRIIPGRLREIFNDSNELQLTAARANGFSPIGDLYTAYALSKPVVKVASCNDFLVDSLSMSMPFLVPKALELLHDIGRTFSDTVRARGGREQRLRVTSLTRTENNVKLLRRRNRAATEQSCHRYGTTFDISWTRFDARDSSYIVSLEDLKNILAEVVYDFRQQGRCYAIFERRQGCFHITVR